MLHAHAACFEFEARKHQVGSYAKDLRLSCVGRQDSIVVPRPVACLRMPRERVRDLIV